MKTNPYPKHYCGIFGVYGSRNAAGNIADGLFALQHRGQEGTGIVTTDGTEFFERKAMGLVAQAYGNGVLTKLIGTSGIGHNRYSTTGGSELKNVQPLVISCHRGMIALAHNGNLTNTENLRTALTQERAVFQTTTDSEIMLHLIAWESDSIEEAIKAMMQQVEGAYSLVILTEHELIAVRDPHGFRPLVIGSLPNEGTVFASETCALDRIGASFVREVVPGEIVIASKSGLSSYRSDIQTMCSFCAFEHIYFARPDSILGNGQSVYTTRLAMGEALAREYPLDADTVVPIPDGGTCAAIGYAQASGIPFQLAFVRNHYSGRSFIHPTQAQREEAANGKLNLIPELVRGKRVVVIDDSVVRGTTINHRVNSLRKAGATAVHILLSCPPHRHPCHYGIDFPDRSKLLAVQYSESEICERVGADSIGYLSEEGLVRAIGTEALCLGCFNGRYPTEVGA